MSDLISRQAAIDLIESIETERLKGNIELIYAPAIKGLRALPPAQPEQLSTNFAEVGTDCISREQAIDALRKLREEDIEDYGCEIPEGFNQDHLDRATFAIKQLPPAQPERIKGHWIESNGLNILMKKFIEKGETWRVCDKCGAGFMIGYQYECDKLYHETFHNFCPKCGAEMEVTT